MGEFRVGRQRRSLSARLHQLAWQCDTGDGALSRSRLPDCLCDFPLQGGTAAVAAVSYHAAVLDQLSDPRLCLDRNPPAQRVAERGADRTGLDRKAITAPQ